MSVVAGPDPKFCARDLSFIPTGRRAIEKRTFVSEEVPEQPNNKNKKNGKIRIHIFIGDH